MPSESFGGCSHLFGESCAAKCRHRKLALARCFEDIAALVNLTVDVSCFPGNTDGVFHLVVIGLEFVVVDRPVLNGGAFGNASGTVATYGFASYFEIPRIEPPALPPVVDGRSAHRVHHWVGALDCHRRGICPERGPFAIGFLRPGRPHISAEPQFVGSHVAGAEPWARVETDDFNACLCERKASDASGCS